MAPLPEGLSLEPGALRSPRSSGSAPGTLCGGGAALSQGVGAESGDSRPAIESWTCALQRRRTEAGHCGIQIAAQKPGTGFRRGPAPDDPHRDGLLWVGRIRRSSSISSAGCRARHAESVIAADPGAQLPVVRAEQMRCEYQPGDFVAGSGVRRGRYAGRRGAGRNERQKRRDCAVSRR